MKLSDITVSAPDELTKFAGVESPDGAQLEQDFGNLAFLFIQDRASKLMPYMLGFEIVEQADDGSRAVGIFGFKVGDDYYYVPAFFLNQQVKGMDLLFSRKGNKFMPLTAEYMDKILDRKALRLGSGVPQDLVQDDFASPDFDFARTPYGAASAGVKQADWAAGTGHSAWNDVHGAVVTSYKTDPQFKRDFAAALSKLAHTELDGVQYEDTLREYIGNHGGPDAAAGVMKLIGSNIKYANAALEFYGSVKDLQVTEFDASLAPVEKRAAVEITTEVSEDMTDCERKRMVTHGIAVVDRREPKAKSKLYDADYSVQFSNPHEGGRYEVLLADGNTVEANVFLSSDATGAAIVTSDDADLAAVADPAAVFVRGDRLGDTAKAYKGATRLDDLQVGTRYILISADGCSSDPFSVQATIAESGHEKVTSYKVWFDRSVRYKRPSFAKSEAFYDVSCDRDSVNRIRVTDDDGKRLRTKGDAMLAPSSAWRALELPDCWHSGDGAFAPGNPLDFEEELYKNAVHRLDVAAEDSGSTFYISLNDNHTGPFGVKQALHELVCRYGLGAPDADAVMKTAAQGGTYGKARKLIKFAQMAGVQMPMPPYAAQQTPESHMGIPMQTPEMDLAEGQMTGLNQIPDSAALGHAVGGEMAQGGDPAQEIAELADQAAQSGQKHVFDHATIGGLARLYDTSSAIDQYIPEMAKSLDRIGRILFMFYWKNEAFEERYGAADMVDLEDTLRSVFKSFGNLVNMLEQQSIASADGEDLSVA